MQHRMPLLIQALTFAIIAVSPVAALDLPARNPGLWEMRMASGGPGPSTLQICLNAAIDREMLEFGNGGRGGTCEKHDVARTNGGFVVDSICLRGTLRQSSHVVITGDFSSAYTATIMSRNDPPGAGGTTPAGETKTTIEARWLGPCKADQQPGDIITSTGAKLRFVIDPATGQPAVQEIGGAPTRPAQPQQ
jgi:uncharacterized protein DUF3617